MNVLLGTERPSLRFGAVLGYLGAISSLIAYSLYAFLMLQGKVETNVVTWVLWAFESILCFRIYRDQVGGDIPKYIQEAAAALGCVAITLLLVWQAYYARTVDIWKPVAMVDGMSVILFLIVLYIYKRYEVKWSTLAFQLVVILSTPPLIRNVYEHPSSEPLLPWIFWTAGFLLQLACVIARNKGGSFYQYLTPANYAFWHGTVAVIVLTSSGHMFM